MKRYLALFCIFLAIASLKTVVSEKKTMETASKCECGLFNNETAATLNTQPDGSKSLNVNVTCDESGKEKCKSLCIALAETTKHDDGIKKLCNRLGTANNYVPKLYFKHCGENEWRFTGGPATIHVCCKEKNMIPCPSAEIKTR